MSLEYLLKAIRFFMMIDTLLNVIKRTKKLLIKLHFLKDIVVEENERESRRNNGLQSLFFENYKNLDIPKNITAKVHEYMTVNLTYPRHPLTSIMKIKSPFEKVSINSDSISFEMLFNTMKKSYAMYLTCPTIRAEVNQHEWAKLLNFKMEMRIIYKKCIRKKVQVLKEMSMDVNQHISFNYLHVNLTSNLFMWIMIFDQIYRKMKKEASVKHDLMKKILQTDFLKENLLKQDYEIENEHRLYETKIPDVIKLIIDIRRVECILFTKDENNTMKALVEDYQLAGTLENRILTATNYFGNLALLSDKMKQNYLKTKGFIYQETRDNRFEDKLPRNFLVKFDTIDLFYNWDLMLSASKDINDLALISKYFKRQNVKYKVQNKFSWVDSVTFTGNTLIVDWFLGGKRYLKFKATDIKTVDTRKPWSKLKEGSMHYTFSTMVVTHTKFKKIPKNEHELDFGPDADQDEEKVLEDDVLKVTDLNYVMVKNKNKLELIFSGNDLGVYIPNHLHFGAIIKAIMKQIRFQIKWHKIAYKEYKVLNRIKLPPRQKSNKTDPRDFILRIHWINLDLRGEDKDIAKGLIYQNEIISALTEKGLTKWNPKIMYEFK